jgi:hypothetical protein
MKGKIKKPKMVTLRQKKNTLNASDSEPRFTSYNVSSQSSRPPSESGKYLNRDIMSQTMPKMPIATPPGLPKPTMKKLPRGLIKSYGPNIKLATDQIVKDR